MGGAWSAPSPKIFGEGAERPGFGRAGVRPGNPHNLMPRKWNTPLKDRGNEARNGKIDMIDSSLADFPESEYPE